MIKYKDFEIVDFLADEFFIHWVTKPSEETDYFWKKWLEKNPGKRAEVNQAREIILQVDYKEKVSLSDLEYTDIYENVMNKTKLEESKSTKRAFYWGFLRNIAAVFFVVSLGLLTYHHFAPHSEPALETEVELITYENPVGRKSSLTLTDGTVVHLNANSSIKIPKPFAEDSRVLELEGEAYFEVKKDSDRPFIVKSGENQVRVLGTSFNVRSDEMFQVALVEGKVEVNDFSGNKITLNPKEMLTKDQNGEFKKTTFDPLEITGWKDKFLVFKDDGFEEVRTKLENWYGVEIQLESPLKKEWSYSGSYHNETLINVLEGISITSEFSYSIEDKTVTITNPK